MIKLINEKEVHGLALDEHIKGIAKYTLSILDDAYGADRDPKADLGGFVVILESEDEVDLLKEYHLNLLTDIPEYTDYVAGNDDNWIVSMYLLSSDYSITVIMPMHIAPVEMLQNQESLQDPADNYNV